MKKKFASVEEEQYYKNALKLKGRVVLLAGGGRLPQSFEVVKVLSVTTVPHWLKKHEGCIVGRAKVETVDDFTGKKATKDPYLWSYHVEPLPAGWSDDTRLGDYWDEMTGRIIYKPTGESIEYSDFRRGIKGEVLERRLNA